jgi:hypothetical protein
MNHNFKLSLATGVMLALGVSASASAAQITIDNTWLTIGDVASTANGYILTNAFAGDDLAGDFSVSATPPVSSNDVESFLGLTPGILGATAYEGSAIKQSFTVQEDDTFVFDWNFLTNETSDDFPDFAFVSINGAIINLATTSEGIFVSSPFALETGEETFSFVFANAGNYTIGIGVLDDSDFVTSSALQVAAVPVPAAAWLFGSALGLVGLIRRRVAA